MNNWQTIDTVPLDTNVLVWISRPLLGVHVWPAKFGSKGKPTVVAGRFVYDINSKPTHWMPMVTGPND